MEKITILIVDDHTLIRESWSFILSNDPRFEVVGEISNGEEGVEQAKILRPDIVLMDINLPGINGIEATHLIRKFSPGSKVIGVSLHTQPAYARKMIQEGAMGYVTKNSPCEEMFKAIIEVQNRRKYICEAIKDIISGEAPGGDRRRAGLNLLSRREIEIIDLIKKGFSSKTIGDALKISFKTVEVHRYNILKKLHLKNSAAMVNYMNNNQFDN